MQSQLVKPVLGMRPDRSLVLVMALVWLLAGVVEPHLPNAGQPVNATSVVQTILLAVLLYAWCKAHATAHQVNPASGAPLLVAVIPPVGVPYYFIQGFGWRKGTLLCFFAICCFVFFYAIYLAAFYSSARVGT